jgi:hypothetical protein
MINYRKRPAKPPDRNLLAPDAVRLYPILPWVVPDHEPAPVAQLDRALPSEGRGREFESRRVRHVQSFVS